MSRPGSLVPRLKTFFLWKMSHSSALALTPSLLLLVWRNPSTLFWSKMTFSGGEIFQVVIFAKAKMPMHEWVSDSNHVAGHVIFFGFYIIEVLDKTSLKVLFIITLSAENYSKSPVDSIGQPTCKSSTLLCLVPGI